MGSAVEVWMVGGLSVTGVRDETLAPKVGQRSFTAEKGLALLGS
jgi:hypothetical protein